MNITVLDGYTLNPGDLSWTALEQFGELTVHDRTAPGEVATRAINADLLLTNKTPVTAETIANLPKLKYIGVLATGYNIVDVAAARAAGIVVTNVPGYSTASVAQLAFSLLLELCLRVQRHSDAVYAGQWTSSPDFCFTVSPLVELQGKTLGIVGMGDIGQAVAAIGRAFGMNIIASSRTRKPLDGVEWRELLDLLAEADAVSLHCPLTPDTQRLIRQETIARMKPTALLINTSRGGLIDEADLAAALNDGRIGGAGLDVLSAEPPSADNPLLQARNCVITPHIAWATREARGRLMDIAASNIEAFLSGKPKNTV